MITNTASIIQTNRCDENSESVVCDSEIKAIRVSSPEFDPSFSKPSLLPSALTSHINKSPYANLSDTLIKDATCNTQYFYPQHNSTSNSQTSHLCDSFQPKSGFESGVTNTFGDSTPFETSVLPYTHSEPVRSGYMSEATAVQSAFSSPRSAFTELHPKSVKSHLFNDSTSTNYYLGSIIQNETHVKSAPTSNISHNDSNDSGSKSMSQMKFVCRICGEIHDSASAHIYNYIQDVDADLCCTLCKQPLVDPLDTKCGHTFCSLCLKNHLAVQALCPVDKQIINYLECQQASNIVKRLLDKLPVACPNRQICDTVSYRSNLEEHLRDCSSKQTSALDKSVEKTTPSTALKSAQLWKESFQLDSNAKAMLSVDTTHRLFQPKNAQIHQRNHYRQQSQQHSNSSDGSANFSLTFNQQCLKEFPNLFSSIATEQDRRLKPDSDNSNLLPTQTPVTTDNRLIIEGTPVSITIFRQSNCADLGFTFVGGLDTPLACILIQEIYLDGPVALDGRLRPGDQLLEVDGNLLTHVTHLEAYQLLYNSSNIVQLTVYREPVGLIVQQQNRAAPYHEEIFYVKLCKRQGKVLGIKLVGKKHLPGLYILELVANCEADLDGRMKKDDQILEINGIDLSNGTQEQAAQIINSVSDYVTFKLSRRNRADTPDILRTTSADIEDKLDSNILGLDSLQLNSDPTHSPNHFHHGWSSLEHETSSLSNAQSTTELIQPSSDHKSESSVCIGRHSPGLARKLSLPKDLHQQLNEPSAFVNVSNLSMKTEVVGKQMKPSTDASCLERTVVVNKTPEEPLGISIAGGRHSQRGDTPIYVTNISTECVLGRSKQVQKGDILLEANGIGLVGLTHHEAVEILRQISQFQTQVRLRLISATETNDGPENFMPSWTYWLRLPPICQLARIICLRRNTSSTLSIGNGSAKPLGFSIVGGLGHDQSLNLAHLQGRSMHKLCHRFSSFACTSPYPCPIVIKSIVPGLLAHKDGRLKCGDLILAVNNFSMLNISHSSAVRLLKQTHGDVVLQVISWPGTIV